MVDFYRMMFYGNADATQLKGCVTSCKISFSEEAKDEHMAGDWDGQCRTGPWWRRWATTTGGEAHVLPAVVAYSVLLKRKTPALIL